MNRRAHAALRICAALSVVALALTGAAIAGAPSLEAYVPQTFVIGDQLYAGGHVEIVAVGLFRDRVAVLIDGKQVAVLDKQIAEPIPSGARAYLALERDPRGLLHIVGIRYRFKDSDDGRTGFRAFRVIHADSGLATVPAERIPRPTEAVATGIR